MNGVPSRWGCSTGYTIQASSRVSCLRGVGRDLLEAEEMLREEVRKEIIDSTNTDGISALNQVRLTRLQSPEVAGRDSAQDSLLCTLLRVSRSDR